MDLHNHHLMHCLLLKHKNQLSIQFKAPMDPLNLQPILTVLPKHRSTQLHQQEPHNHHSAQYHQQEAPNLLSIQLLVHMAPLLNLPQTLMEPPNLLSTPYQLVLLHLLIHMDLHKCQ